MSLCERKKNSISVIIPTYNRNRLLKRALSSVFAQCLAADQVIVIDDGSSDNSAAMVDREFPEVELIVQQNKGVSQARNVGIKSSTSEWVALLDSDDEWLPTKLEQQQKALSAPGQFLICHSDEIWIRNGVRVNAMKKHAKTGGWIFEKCLPLCVISPSSVMIHYSVFEQVGLFDPLLPACEDYDLWLRICAKLPVLYIETPLIVKYGGHPDQLSQQYWGMDRFRMQALQKLMEQTELTAEQSALVRNILIKKAKIYIKGAQKRGKQQEVMRYTQMINSFHSLG